MIFWIQKIRNISLRNGDFGHITQTDFAPSAFQNLLYQAAGDADGLVFAGKFRSVDSIVLLYNGISFAIQILVFLVIGSFADIWNWRPHTLIIFSIIAYGVAVGLYMVGLIAYQTTLTFWIAAFPSLARNSAEIRKKANDLTHRVISREEYDCADTMKRSQLANVSFHIQSLAEILILVVIVRIVFGVGVDADETRNNWGLSVLIAFASDVWQIVSLRWFVFEKRRSGQDPGSRNIVMAGLSQLYFTMRQVWKLKQSLLYLVGYFLLGDSLITTDTVILTLKNSLVAYNTFQLTYLLITVGIYFFWSIQQQYELGTRTMFNATAVGMTLLDGWGMIGIWTDKFGFHHEWEVWVYQAFYGLFMCPWYSYSQIMISEVTPCIVGKTSSFIGPLVPSAIIEAIPSGNLSSPFYVLFALSLLGFGILFVGVHIKKRLQERDRFLKEKEPAWSGGTQLCA
ncbi:autophagy-related protein 22-like protein [Aspergillus floccosus]